MVLVLALVYQVGSLGHGSPSAEHVPDPSMYVPFSSRVFVSVFAYVISPFRLRRLVRSFRTRVPAGWRVLVRSWVRLPVGFVPVAAPRGRAWPRTTRTVRIRCVRGRFSTFPRILPSVSLVLRWVPFHLLPFSGAHAFRPPPPVGFFVPVSLSSCGSCTWWVACASVPTSTVPVRTRSERWRTCSTARGAGAFAISVKTCGSRRTSTTMEFMGTNPTI